MEAGGWDVSEDEFAAVVALDASARYDYLVKRIVDHAAVWSLRADDGWALVSDDAGRELVPVWPHPRYARACVAVGDPSEPTRIALAEWIEAWLPGIERDRRGVVVFPTPNGQGAVVEPTRMLVDLSTYQDANY